MPFSELAAKYQICSDYDLTKPWQNRNDTDRGVITMTKVFVYGRLMAGYHYHQHYLQGKTFLGTGVVNDYKSYMLGGGLQGIVPEKGEHVDGEVYEVDQKTLDKLDLLHNNGERFNRRMVDVELENGESLQTEVYVLNG